jgi:Flp pilus assembly protein TadB
MNPAIIVALLAFVAFAAGGWVLTASPQTERAAKRAKEIGSAKGNVARRAKTDDPNARRRAATQESLREMARQQKTRRRNLLAVKAQLE